MHLEFYVLTLRWGKRFSDFNVNFDEVLIAGVTNSEYVIM